MKRSEVRRQRQQQQCQNLMTAVKMIILVLILIITFPFYGGVTTSALEDLYFIHYQEDLGKPVPVDQQQGPDANGEPSSSEKPTEEHGQVIPVPTEAPAPSAKPATPPPVTPFPDITPTPTPPATQDPANGENGEIPAGVLLQGLLSEVYRHEGEKVAYLTFDDGPFPSNTYPILDILREENIKATFFAIGTSVEFYPDVIRKVYEEGHGIGNHTYSHVFKDIYASPEHFVEELLTNEKLLQTTLNTDRLFRLIRFPGGSFGDKLASFRDAVNVAGFGYIDWNSLNGDAESVKSKSPEELLERLKETVYGQSGLVVLMHDAPNKENTVEALPSIIEYLRSEGYRFDVLPGS
jgi:peptidoglycan/xylan/chitin deacetylase (PgdA/CDA1 family)